MLIPSHWSFRGPRLFDPRFLRWRNVPGAHVHAVRRIIRFGPWSLILFQYKRGHVNE